MSVGSARADDSYGHSTSKVAKADNKSSSEKAVPGVLSLLECSEVVVRVRSKIGKLSRHDNSDNQSIDSNSLAENNRD